MRVPSETTTPGSGVPPVRTVPETRKPGIAASAKLRLFFPMPAIVTGFMKLDGTSVTPGAVATRFQLPFGTELMNDRDGGQILVKKQYVITGERINGAEPAFDGQNNQPIVRVSTDSQGARILREITGQNVGNRMAIVLIEKGKPEVITAPTIQSELGSNFQISGRMSTRETSDVALLIRSGSIAAPMEIIEERTVGPSLGAENIDRGFNSVTWGFVALAAFVCVYYAVMGLISTLALSVNLLLLIAILSMLQATLTLPGIAAIALTLGMAIDANALINESIREELRAGDKPQEAI